MKKHHIILLVIIFILLIISIILSQTYFKNSKNNSNDYTELKKYISNIFGKSFLIPEFDDINKADENWLWENINQYLWNTTEYEKRNSKEFDYSYEEICNFAKTLYGDNLKKSVPTGSTIMRYDETTKKYGPTAYGLENYYDYKIDSIKQNGNIFTISIYDYTVSLFNTLGENPKGTIDIFNNYDYLLNTDDGTPVISINGFDDENYINLLNYKNKLSHKVLTIEFDESSNNYHIKSCKYLDISPKDILSTYYKKMQDTFEIWNIKYDYEEIYTSDEVLVENFDTLSEIYTKTALETYKKEMDLFTFKDDKVFITAGDINIGDYISKIEFNSIESSDDKITCTVIRNIRESFDSDDENYNTITKKTDTFTIIKVDNEWKIDEFSYNNN